MRVQRRDIDGHPDHVAVASRRARGAIALRVRQLARAPERFEIGHEIASGLGRPIRRAVEEPRIRGHHRVGYDESRREEVREVRLHLSVGIAF